LSLILLWPCLARLVVAVVPIAMVLVMVLVVRPLR
jgi:hypothetical protein